MTNENNKIIMPDNFSSSKTVSHNEEYDSDYATKKELNIEATLRAEGDQAVIGEFDYFKKNQEQRLKSIDDILIQEKQLIDDLSSQVDNNKDKIVTIEKCFYEQIKDLEAQKAKLTLQLVAANEIIKNKDQEVKQLRDEITTNDDYNSINLKFAQLPEFKINKVQRVKDFILEQLKDVVVARMSLRYPGCQFLSDYTIALAGLEYGDVMQGKEISVIVSALSAGKLKGATNFFIQVNYEYSYLEQEKFLDQFLRPAIPTSLINIGENATPSYDLKNEIIKTQPLRLLLNQTELKVLPFKIFAEMNAASYWTDYQRSWQLIRDDYVGTGQSTIGGNKIINNVKDLYVNTTGYYHQIFKAIEKRITDSGVPCQITKKLVKYNGWNLLAHNLGNLTFSVSHTNLENDDIITVQSRHYYMMVNFELKLSDSATKFYRGVTLALTDSLELYV